MKSKNEGSGLSGHPALDDIHDIVMDSKIGVTTDPEIHTETILKSMEQKFQTPSDPPKKVATVGFPIHENDPRKGMDTQLSTARGRAASEGPSHSKN